MGLRAAPLGCQRLATSDWWLCHHPWAAVPFPLLCLPFQTRGGHKRSRTGMFGLSPSWCGLSPALGSCSEWGGDWFGSSGDGCAGCEAPGRLRIPLALGFLQSLPGPSCLKRGKGLGFAFGFELQQIQQRRWWFQLYLVGSSLTFFSPLSPSSIRQYELVVHTDVNMNKVYTGEMGRLKSYENQKP